MSKKHPEWYKEPTKEECRQACKAQEVQAKRDLEILKEALVGRTITDVGFLHPDENEKLFYQPNASLAFYITLDDGTQLIPFADEEGNYPGCVYLPKPIGNEKMIYPMPMQWLGFFERSWKLREKQDS